MSCNHEFEDYFATGYVLCVHCGLSKGYSKSLDLTHILSKPISNVSITLYLASGEVIENL